MTSALACLALKSWPRWWTRTPGAWRPRYVWCTPRLVLRLLGWSAFSCTGPFACCCKSLIVNPCAYVWCSLLLSPTCCPEGWGTPTPKWCVRRVSGGTEVVATSLRALRFGLLLAPTVPPPTHPHPIVSSVQVAAVLGVAQQVLAALRVSCIRIQPGLAHFAFAPSQCQGQLYKLRVLSPASFWIGQDNVDAVFPIVVPALASQLVASRSGAVAAATVLDSMCAQTSKPHLLATAYVAALQQHRGNVRIQAAVVEKLAGACVAFCSPLTWLSRTHSCNTPVPCPLFAPNLHRLQSVVCTSGVVSSAHARKPDVVERQVLTALFQLLDVAKPEVRAAVGTALSACSGCMGKASVLAAASSLSDDNRAKLKSLLAL